MVPWRRSLLLIPPNHTGLTDRGSIHATHVATAYCSSVCALPRLNRSPGTISCSDVGPLQAAWSHLFGQQQMV